MELEWIQGVRILNDDQGHAVWTAPGGWEIILLKGGYPLEDSYVLKKNEHHLFFCKTLESAQQKAKTSQYFSARSKGKKL